MITERISHLKYLEEVKSKTSDNIEKQLISSLYGDIGFEDISQVDATHLAKTVADLKKLLANRKSGEHKVAVFRESEDSDFLALEIISNDMPFLLDSISNEIKSLSLGIHLIVHPSIKVERDKAGNYLDLTEDGVKESIIIFHLSNWIDKSFDTKLITRITNILECVTLAVNDWKAMLAEMHQGVKILNECKFNQNHNMRAEYIEFFEWLINDNMVVLGSADFTTKNDALIVDPKSKLGLLKSSLYQLDEIKLDDKILTCDPINIRKWDKRSVVHRASHLDQIIIKKYSDKGVLLGAKIFFGLYTSTVYYQSVRNIPFMRKKVAAVVERYGYPPSSYNCKELITAIESFPRGELLQMTVDELYDTATAIVSLTLIPRVKVFLRRDQGSYFTSVIIFIPEKRFSTGTRAIIEGIVCKYLNGVTSKKYVQIGESSLARLQLIIKMQSLQTKEIKVELIEKDIIAAISVWSDALDAELFNSLHKKEAAQLFTKYKDAFDIKYQSMFSGTQAVYDLTIIEQAFATNTVLFDVYQTNKGIGGKDFIHLKIYSPEKELPLSSTLPMIENLGLFAVDVLTYQVVVVENSLPKTLYLHHFRLNLVSGLSIAEYGLNGLDEINSALYRIWANDIDDDIFNSLIITANITYREALLLRSYAKYCKQTLFAHSYETILETLRTYPHITHAIVELFKFKFGPQTKLDYNSIEKKQNEIVDYLKKIKSAIEDQIFRCFIELITATLRTNFFQLCEHNDHKNYLSFKFKSSTLSFLPQPRPYAEIYVYSTRFEGIHLRGGKIARGGIRWSDRKDDYRFEILGLMKAQMTKNSVIVPVGSKGGFIIKKISPKAGVNEYLNEGIDCYKQFLSGMLDLTDNIVGKKVVTPKDIITYDDQDPYLVVAADKGTASFSDYANSVSQKYDFWLDDAFASGGSAGYDHKKMAITARGAWVCATRHFKEIGLDINKDEISVVAIGDMSGDVMGNGMLLSEKLKLVAAFNHEHIFLDPNPDPKKSFVERKRLFALQRSKWSDYDQKSISKGGGVYSRSDKLIVISPEAKAVLDVDKTEFTPEELIRAILKAPVHMLWNGGIGTYVKASTESHASITDKANDGLRINGKELRCKVVAEGGNLGFTQLGRIEYARNGGRINADFIDNSAGVDCSDHEVNIKIGFASMLKAKKLTIEQRNKILVEMTNSIGSLVLDDNQKQSLIISIEQYFAVGKLPSHAWLINLLESQNKLDRNLEFLPNSEKIISLAAASEGLTRPEIAVILAYSKNSIYEMLNKFDYPKDKVFNAILNSYFPKLIIDEYPEIIGSHKLKNDIIATILTNEFVNILGTTFFHQLLEGYTVSAIDIIRAFLIAKEVLNIDALWNSIEELDVTFTNKNRYQLYKVIQETLERSISWILANAHDAKHPYKIIDTFAKVGDELKKALISLPTNELFHDYQDSLAPFENIPEARRIAEPILQLKLIQYSFDIIGISDNSKKTPCEIAEVFFKVSADLEINWLTSKAKSYSAKSYIQVIALRMLMTQISKLHKDIVILELEGHNSVFKNPKIEQYHNFIAELKKSDLAEAFISKITIVISKMQELFH